MPILNMSCGQTDLHPSVLNALSQQIEGPIYYPPYWELEIDTIDILRRLMQTNNDVLLISGSATYGIEAALKSLIDIDERVLILNSGMYGQVLVDLARIHENDVVELATDSGNAIDTDAVRASLKANPDVALVAAVHCDTSTGIMTRVNEVGLMLKTEFPETLFMVDAVSSVGAVDLRVDEWGIDICCTSPQKCLNGPQGLAVVSVSQRAWRKGGLRKTPLRTLCLDLSVWKEYHDGVRQAHIKEEWSDISVATKKAAHGPSPSYSLVAGLHAAIEAIIEEGLAQVYQRHQLAGEAIRLGVRAMGLGTFAKEESAAPVATRLVFPYAIDWTELAKRALFEHNLALASGFRIGTMGQSASKGHVLATLAKLTTILQELGYPWDTGVEAAEGLYQQNGL